MNWIITNRTRGHKWMRIREAILTRDCGLCVPCKAKGKLTIATEVDHILQLADGGTDDHSNLQSICHNCHADKTARENGKKRKAETGIDGWPVDDSNVLK